jgi:pimeloyl-ACP methyl ester carboxylesterase
MNVTPPVPAFPSLPGHAGESGQGVWPGAGPRILPWVTDTRLGNPWAEYAIDAWQRTVLFLDTLRQRGNAFLEHEEDEMRNVLDFDFDLVVDGRTLARPVNYWLASIHPPEGAPPTDPHLRPFVIIDPRAGHGAGIGGFKADSEIGCAIAGGHPCYFVGFRPEPEPRQTLEDVVHAIVDFVETAGRLHQEAEGAPVVIGNCQAGWATLIAAAIRPEAFGPIIVAGTPVSYWAGTEGFAPMRYLGGLLGGSWLTALTGDLGGGKFDGAWLVSNFEVGNPVNTYWTKQYNLWSKVDTEAPRYLGFERYWGGHVMLNAEEMQFIVDQLFIGNRLATAELTLSDGTRVDLRSIQSPILVFCSRGDNITPPAQALSWISDLYTDKRDLQSHNQTIIYAVHEEIGHLGIFVSGAVARKEHREFASNIDLIDVIPPGLYQATLRDKKGLPGAELVEGDYLLGFEPREVADLAAFGGTSPEDEKRFATARRVSEINLGLYRATLGAALKQMPNPVIAEALRHLHPARLSYTAFSDRNPAMQAIATLAQQTRENRRPVPADNPGRVAERQLSDAMTRMLKGYGASRDTVTEKLFQVIYDSPGMQVLAGVTGSAAPPRQKPGSTAEHRRFVEQVAAGLGRRLSSGGAREAVVRAILHVVEGNRIVDARAFEMLRRIRAQFPSEAMTLTQFKDLLREQFFMLLLNEQGALAALPALLPKDETQRRTAYEIVRAVTTAAGEATPEALARLKALAPVFDVDPDAPAASVAITAQTAHPRIPHRARRRTTAKPGKKR